MVFLLVPRADTSAVWSRCVSLTCLESGVTHILSVAVADRFSILVADQGQMLDIERRTYTASSKIWMEQLTCSLLSCHCEARNQWLVAWDKSNWQLQKWAQQHWLSAIEASFWEMMQSGSGFVVFLVGEKNHSDFMLEMLDTETRISTASSRIWMGKIRFCSLLIWHLANRIFFRWDAGHHAVVLLLFLGAALVLSIGRVRVLKL